jgi:hypothetical protein
VTRQAAAMTGASRNMTNVMRPPLNAKVNGSAVNSTAVTSVAVRVFIISRVFLRLLYEPAVWKKWAGREKTKAAGWAGLPLEKYTVGGRPPTSDGLGRSPVRHPGSDCHEVRILPHGEHGPPVVLRHLRLAAPV